MNLDSKLNIYLKSGIAKAPRKLSIQPPRIGYLRETSLGKLWVVDWEYQKGQLHGGFEIEKLHRVSEIFDIRLADFDPSLATVIDTETTGLAGGTGTYAFIIGAGFWQGEKFIVRQYMLRDFNEEPAQLTALAEDYTGSLISYNGKCFDMPLLMTRYRLHRFEPPFDNAPHLDMLFPCRRIWKRNLAGFKLTQVEQQVLGYARDGDIPSHMIPSIFFDYLQTRDEALLYPILHHNRDDILSLYHLTVVATSIINQCLENNINDDDLLLSLAEIFFNSGNYDQVLDIVGKIKDNFASKDTLKKAVLLKGLAYKKLGRWNEAIGEFNRLHDYQPDLFSAVELAKLYEHRLRNPAKALEYVLKAQMLCELGACAGLDNSSSLSALTHRANRLRRKINCMLHN